MSGSYEEALPTHTVAGLIEEVVRLAEMLAIDHRVGAPPARMVTSVVGIREFAFRLFGHYEECMKSSQPLRTSKQVGFPVPSYEDRGCL